MFRAQNLWLTYRMRFFISLAALIMLGATCSQAAAADCAERPNLRQAHGHWFYRIDHATHHRCWYLQKEAQSAASPPAEPKLTPKLTLASVPASISSLFTDWKGSPSAPSQQNVAMAAVPPKPSAVSTAVKKNVSAAHNRRVAMNDRPATPLRSHQGEFEQAGHQQHQLDSGQREELFEDFLRWSVRRD